MELIKTKITEKKTEKCLRILKGMIQFENNSETLKKIWYDGNRKMSEIIGKVIPFSDRSLIHKLTYYLCQKYMCVFEMNQFKNPEPFPDTQKKILEVSGIDDMTEVSFLMFIKGMESRFWELLPENEFNNIFRKLGNTPEFSGSFKFMTWLIPVILIYAETNLIQFQRELDRIDSLKYRKLELDPGPIFSSKYFTVDLFEKTNINVKLEKTIYRIIPVDTMSEIRFSRLSFENISSFNTSNRKSGNLHLSDLGIMQMTKIGDHISYYFWASESGTPNPTDRSGIQRYILTPYRTRIAAVNNMEANNSFNKYGNIKMDLSDYNSTVIFIPESLEPGPDMTIQVQTKNMYYTVSKDPPYRFYDIPEKYKLFANTIKYIFGISISEYSLGIFYDENQHKRLYSINNSPFTGIAINLDLNQIRNLELKYKKWFETMKNDIDNKYRARLEIVCSHL